MPADKTASRRRQLLDRLKSAEVDALLVTNFKNVTYLTGFSGDDSYLLIGRGITVLVSDSRYETQISEECPGLDVHIRKTDERMDAAVAKVVGRAKLKKLGFESTSTTYDQWERLTEAVKPLQLTALAGAVEKLRIIKDSGELDAIRSAIRQAERGFEVLRASLTPEMTELQAAHELEHAMRRFGALEASFDPIVAVGPRSALPHARPGGARISDSPFVLVDWGASESAGYKSDLTRVLVTGKISPKLENI